MNPFDRLPDEYNPRVLTRAFEKMYEQVRGVEKRLRSELTPKRVTPSSEQVGGEPEPVEQLDVLTGLTATIWFRRIMIAKFDRTLFHRIKGQWRYEWHLTTTGVPADTDTYVYHTPGNRMIAWMPTRAHTYVSVRSEGFFGRKLGPYTTVEGSDDTTSTTIPAPTFVSGEVSPLRHTHWKWSRYRATFRWSIATTEDEVDSVEWKVNRASNPATLTVTGLGNHGVGKPFLDGAVLVVDGAETMPFRPTNAYVNETASGYYVHARCWNGFRCGDWVSQALTYGYPSTDAFDIPVPYWELDGGFLQARKLLVRCCPSDYVFPDNFAYFSIHARKKESSSPSTTWEGHTVLISKDRIATGIGRDAGVNGVECWLPWYLIHTKDATSATRLDGSTTDTDSTHLVLTKNISLSKVSIKVVVHTWDRDDGTGVVALAAHTKDSEGRDGSDGAGDGCGDGYSAGGDVQYLGGTYQVGDSSTGILIDGVNTIIKSNNYVEWLSGFKISPDLIEAYNIRARGSLEATTMRVNSLSAVGGNVLIAAATTLTKDVSDAEVTSITVLDQVFVTDDLIYAQIADATDGTRIEGIRITSDGTAATAPDEGWVYTIARPTTSSKTSTVAVGGVSSSSGALFSTAPTLHGMMTGQGCTLSGFSETGYNTTEGWVVVVSTTTFRVIVGSTAIAYSADDTGTLTKPTKLAWSKGTTFAKYATRTTSYGTIKLLVNSSTPSIQINKSTAYSRAIGTAVNYMDINGTGIAIKKGGDISLEYDASNPAEIKFSTDFVLTYKELSGQAVLSLGDTDDTCNILIYNGLGGGTIIALCDVWGVFGTGTTQQTHPDSTAASVADLRSDYNGLLAHLRAYGILSA